MNASRARLCFNFEMLRAILLLLVLSGCAPPADVPALFVGDSITANWPLADVMPGAVNSAAPAINTAMIRVRLAKQLQLLQPDVVHILGGTNDDIRPPRGRRAIARILRMVDAAQASGAFVIVGTIPPLDATKFWQQPYVANFNDDLHAAAVARGACVADYFIAMTIDGKQNPALFDDGIHPNAAGYRVMRAELEKKCLRR